MRCADTVPRSLRQPHSAASRAGGPDSDLGPGWARALAWTGVALALARGMIACLEGWAG